MNGEPEIECDERVEDGPTEPLSRERAGVYLVALAALAVPSLIVLALFLPALSPSGADAFAGSGGRTEADDDGPADLGGLNVAPIDEVTSEDAVRVDVAGAGQDREQTTSSEAPTTTTSGAPADTQAVTPATATAVAPRIAARRPSTPPSVVSTTTVATVESTERAPTTLPTTTVAPSSTTTAPTSAPATTEPVVEPADFAQRIDIGRIGETTLQFRFESATDTSYVATVRTDGTTVVRSPGTARANTLVNELIQGLDPGTDYSLQVELLGPPSAQSPSISFRTSGGQPDLVDTPVSLENLRIAEIGPTRFELTYESNICANGSFTIREQDGPIVGSNTGQAAGCTTRHLAIPGFWTSPLKPNTTYTITVQVEAGGAGRGNGNVASETLTVTTGV